MRNQLKHYKQCRTCQFMINNGICKHGENSCENCPNKNTQYVCNCLEPASGDKCPYYKEKS
jgi:hypothetical protein